MNSGPDQSRCDFKGRKDRVALEFRGSGARSPNIRRVFAVSSRQQEERILRCREVDTNLDGVKDLFRAYNAKGDLIEEQADTDYDGRVDTWIKFAGDQIKEARFDRNGDGRPDEERTYDAGKLARTKKDASLDGRFDTWEVYDDGRLTRVGVDVDGDGQVDQWRRDLEYERQREVEAAAKEAKARAGKPSEPSASPDPSGAKSSADPAQPSPPSETPKP